MKTKRKPVDPWSLRLTPATIATLTEAAATLDAATIAHVGPRTLAQAVLEWYAREWREPTGERAPGLAEAP